MPVNLPLGHDTDADGPGKPRLLSFTEGVRERVKESRYHSGAIWFTYSEVERPVTPTSQSWDLVRQPPGNQARVLYAEMANPQGLIASLVAQRVKCLPALPYNACNGLPGSIPGLGRCPGEGNDNPLQYSCLENPMDRGAWWTSDSP